MKDETFFMKAGLIAHSTETVATTAVTSAGIAGHQSEQRDHARMQTRACARRAPGGSQVAQFQSDHDQETERHQAVAGQDRQDDALGGNYRGKAGENDECGERQNQCRADGYRPKAARGAAFQSRIGENNSWSAATRRGWRGHVRNHSHVPLGMHESLVAVRQLCCKIATKNAARVLGAITDERSRSIPEFLHVERLRLRSRS